MIFPRQWNCVQACRGAKREWHRPLGGGCCAKLERIWAAERARAGAGSRARSPARRLPAIARCDGWTIRFKKNCEKARKLIVSNVLRTRRAHFSRTKIAIHRISCMFKT